jgi:hypothetical protein
MVLFNDIRSLFTCYHMLHIAHPGQQGIAAPMLASRMVQSYYSWCLYLQAIENRGPHPDTETDPHSIRHPHWA